MAVVIGSMPRNLQALSSEGFLSKEDTVDPWGHPYAYRLGPSAYELGSRSSADAAVEDLVVRRPFSASQRMVLEGGAIDRGRSIRP